MNVKNNKRRRESQEKIERAFIELLQTCEIKDITVSDLIKKTQLNRSTFYANYIDIFDLADKTREVLENALSDFDGTMLVVSHDRYFINKLANKTVYLTHDGAVNIDGNYDNYLQYRENQNAVAVTDKEEKKPIVNDYKLRKEKASNERKRKTRISKLEVEIEETENKISLLEEEISTPEISANYEKLLEYTNNLNDLRTSLEDMYSEWEELQTEE